jgi:hypothetical protein
MTNSKHCGISWSWQILLALAVCFTSRPARAHNLEVVLARTTEQVSAFLEEFSDVKCTEIVQQEKLGKGDKVELREESTYDYLVILTNTDGELGLDESRVAMHEARPDNKKTSLLVTNGFATLFLIFHPYYSSSFRFSDGGEEMVNGHLLSKVTFQHVQGTRSPAALALRGREYPLELSGTAWIDPQSGMIEKITAGIENSLQDVGLKTLRSEIEYTPAPFKDLKQTYWFPAQATVEVETPRQHWRNTHIFSDYKRFSVSTDEQVANK